MRKIALLAIGLLTLMSCKKEGNNGGGTTPTTWPEYLQGSWNLNDVEMQIKLTFQGVPLSLEGESVTTSGFYKFNSDNTFEYDWAANVAIEIPFVGPDTIPIAQDGNGTYLVLGENQIEMVQQGDTSIMDLKTKSPSLIIAEFEESMMMDSLGVVEIDVEAILTK